MFGNIGPMEIGIVLIIALVVFGPKRLPELGNGLGRGLREFKETISGEREDAVAALPAQESPVPDGGPSQVTADREPSAPSS